MIMKDNKMEGYTTIVHIIANFLEGKNVTFRDAHTEMDVTITVQEVTASFDWEWRGFCFKATDGRKFDNIDITDKLKIV